MIQFTRAIVRPPGRNFADGLTSVELGTPDYKLATEQHQTYCHALRTAGMSLIQLDVDDNYPDSTFVEDTAVVTQRGAIITRPGAESRAGEVTSVQHILTAFFPRLSLIQEPGTLDGGDVCEAGTHFFIGLSRRTNEEGATQLVRFLSGLDYTSSLIDIRGLSNILHLKSGLAYLGNNRLVVIDSLAHHNAFRGYDLVAVDRDEEYAANCIDVNGRLFVASGYPVFEQNIRGLGYETLTLDMSEFRKMDGGLSCLSIRF